MGPEPTHRLSAVRSTQGVRWFYNAEESDGKASEECTYLVGCFPHSGESIIGSDIDLCTLLYLTYYKSLDCGTRK